MNKKPMAALILSLIAVLMLIMTFFFPWYSAQNTMETWSPYEEEYMEEYESKSKSNYYAYYGHSITETEYTFWGETDWEEIKEDHDKECKITAVFSNTRILVIVAIIGIVAGVGMIFMVINGNLNPKIAVVILAIGFAFAIIAPIYMMTSLPTAIGEDNEIPGGIYYGGPLDEMSSSFFGSYTERVEGMEMEMTWGGSTSWYIAIIAAAVTVGTIAVFYFYIPEEELELAKEYIEGYEGMEEVDESIQRKDEEKTIIH